MKLKVISSFEFVNDNHGPTAEKLNVYYTSGTHSEQLAKHKKTGIHSFWVTQVDHWLTAGSAPAKVYMQLLRVSTDSDRDVMPSLQQIRYRKQSLFKSDKRLNTTHDLSCYMSKFQVCLFNHYCCHD
jgi:hypothetical protein